MQVAQLTVDGIQVGCEVKIANHFFERARGLLACDILEPDQALLISPCSSIHTVGMSYPLDIVFLDQSSVVLKVVSDVRPFRFRWVSESCSVLEVLVGGADRFNIVKGSALSFRKNSG